jgi:hypothetical protein
MSMENKKAYGFLLLSLDLVELAKRVKHKTTCDVGEK